MRESKGGRELPRHDICGLLHLPVDVVVQLKRVDGRFRMTSSTIPRCAGEGVPHEGGGRFAQVTRDPDRPLRVGPTISE